MSPWTRTDDATATDEEIASFQAWCAVEAKRYENTYLLNLEHWTDRGRPSPPPIPQQANRSLGREL